MKKVAILQSNYIPWKGYFDMIHRVDEFIFLDDVQYTTGDWRNRNKVKTKDGLKWLSIPCGSSRNRKINEVEINNNSWQKKHWLTLEHSYRDSQFFNWVRQHIEEVYLEKDWTSLSELNQFLIKKISVDMLQINALFSDSTDYPSSGRKTGKLVEILHQSNADIYLSGPAAKSYLDVDLLIKNKIEVEWMSYNEYPQYDQFYPPFSHQVSILDLLFHKGPEASRWIWELE